MTRVAFYHFNALVPEAGGVERVATSLMSELEKRGMECYGIYRFGEVGEGPGARHFRIPDDDLSSLKNAEAIAGFIKEKRIDVLINLSAILNNSSLCALEGARIAGIPHVAVYHNTFELPLHANAHTARWMAKPAARSILRTLLAAIQRLPGYKGANYIARHSAACITLAKSYIPEFYKFVSRRHPHVDYIYNPYFLPESSGKDTAKEKMALFVGRLSMQKDAERLLKAWQLTDRREWKLYIVGSGPEEENLKKLSRELGISDSVSFEGHQNPVEWYSRASLFCMTSSYEGFPMTLIECQTFGCVPVVMDRFTAASEIIRNDDNGVLVESDSPMVFARVLTSLISDPARTKKMSRACVAEAPRYSLAPIADKWAELIHSVTNNTKEK